MFSYYSSDTSPKTLLNQPNTLAVKVSDIGCLRPSEPGLVPTGLNALGPTTLEAIQLGREPVERGVRDRCYWSASSDAMLVSIWLSYQECQTIESATHNAYVELVSAIRGNGYQHLARMWNFLPSINSGLGDDELYKKFCTGRLQAFSDLKLPRSAFPSASALGHYTTGAVFTALGTRSPVKHFENPRQQSAYIYPRQYGLSSPSFARASQVSIGGRLATFISGTASILGHETQAPNQVITQTRITIDNLQHLQEHIFGAATKRSNAQQLKDYRVYIRHTSDFENIKRYLSDRLPNMNLAYYHADICRNDLLIEIEAAGYISEHNA